MSNAKRAQTSIITRARRTELLDAEAVLSLVNRQTCELFGPNCKELGKLFELIEKSVLSITLEDEVSNRILAQACFYDYPNVYNVQPGSWETWLDKSYNSTKNNSLNTLFLHFFASHSDFSIGSAAEIIKNAFKAVPECHYILLCVPTNAVPDASLSSIFSEMKRRADSPAPTHQNCSVFVVNRDKHIPVLHIREANVNDNDDLIPLFNSYTELLKATYGEFYVAEMIEAQNEENKCLTAEAEGYGIGFMALTKDVNVKLLNECFELRPFHGLCKPHPDDILESSQPTDANDVNDTESSPAVMKHKISDAGIMDMDELEEHSIEKVVLEKKRRFVPEYCGEANAFAIQLFCIDEKYETRSLDFLPHAFECFPDRDFCIITLPHNVPEFALIQNFVRVTPRDTNKLSQELYLFHRAGLVKWLEVREASRLSDLSGVEKLVQNMASRDGIITDLKMFARSRKDASSGVDLQAYVAEVLGRIVGVAIVRQEEDIEYLRANFNIDDFIFYSHHRRNEHGHVNHFALVPIFSFLTKFFLREVLRKSNKTSLYYPIYPEYAPMEISQKYSLITALNFMVPVKRRSQIEYNPEKLGLNMPSDSVLAPKHNYLMPCALNHINRKLLLEPKVAINLRIVVVGASELAVSFLETLVFSPHLRFNNLTLVSNNGLPGALAPDSLRDNMRPQTMNYSQADYAALSLRSWINVIDGKMTWIDRRRKTISVNGRTALPYDHLILCMGEQYYHVAPMQAQIVNPYSRQEVKPHLARPLFDKPPSNMFVVNDEYDAENLLAYVEKANLTDSQENLVVYGLDLNALSLIQTLVEMGVEPKRFSVVCDKNAIGFFNNPTVSGRVLEALERLDVKVYEGYQMQEWNACKWNSGQDLRNIYFQKIKNPKVDDEESPRSLSIDCCLLLCFYRKDVDYAAFIAANQSHLVYDGRLVIDNDFHTNDSCIRAAGKLTKYKRSYYVNSWSHACFNQKEIGVDLASKILKLVDPTLITDGSDEEKSDSARVASNEPDEKILIPLYKKPVINTAVLPGGYFYLNVSKPGLLLKYEDEMDEKGEELVTDTDNGYFRIHLNKNNCVQTITCLSKKNFNASNLKRLYGMHEKFLNKLVLKYKQKSIKDLFTYFNESWCMALFHDRFEELCKELRELSINSNNGLKSVNDLLQEQIDNDLILTKDQRNLINDYFVKSQTKSLVEKRLLSYLNYNYNHLPNYAKPDMV